MAAAAVLMEMPLDGLAFAAEARLEWPNLRVYGGPWIVHDPRLRRELELTIGSSAWHAVFREQKRMQLLVLHPQR